MARNRYAKGARFERELLHFLHGMGFSVIRGPASGGELSPIDVVAMKKGLIVAVECKNWNTKPRLSRDKIQGMKMWCERAGAIGFLSWRAAKDWLFLPLTDAEVGNYADEYWLPMKNVLSALDIQ
ncbi:MAG: restriction endonuclease [Nanoarchaeota archaeon]|nr:restriction endonuclease [Nanoarchaeota archaeon]